MAEKALSFDGVDDKIDLGDDDAFTLSSGFTLELWLKATELNGNDVLIGKFTDGSHGEYQLWISGSILRLTVFDDTNSAYIYRDWTNALTTLNNGSWHYVVALWDGGTAPSSIKLYCDNVQKDDAGGSGGTFAAMRNTTESLMVGKSTSHDTAKATIDEVRISDTTRSTGEVAAIWNDGNGVQFEPDANTVVLFHLNEGTGTDAGDSSGNSHDGTITGAGWVDGYSFLSSKPTSSDTGQGAEALLGRAYILPEVGTGSEALGSRLLGVAEEGGGTETLLARLLASTETASGLDFGGLFFVSSDVGSGLDAILALEVLLTGADSGSGIGTAFLIKALLSTDSGLGTDAIAALLASIVGGELMVGSDRLVVKIESAPMGGGMRLPPGGKTSIPSRRVSL